MRCISAWRHDLSPSRPEKWTYCPKAKPAGSITFVPSNWVGLVPGNPHYDRGTTDTGRGLTSAA